MININFFARRSFRHRYHPISGRFAGSSCCVSFSSSSNNNTGDANSRILTPEDSGRQAEAMAASSNDDKDDHYYNYLPVSAGTLMAHAGIQHNTHNAPMAPPIHFASTYTRPADGNYTPADATYSRADNPTRLQLERTIFELECLSLSSSSKTQQQPSTFAFSSGMMAVTAIVLAHSSPLTVLLPEDVYHGVPTVLTDVFERHNVKTKRIDMTNSSSIKMILHEAIEQAKGNNEDKDGDVIVWMETPSNPKCQIIDIQAVCEAAKDYNNVTTVIDGTMTSPVITRPLELGADISMHSGTKYMGGHSDALLGVATASPWTERGKQLSTVLKTTQIATGGVASAMDSWLVLRGVRTLNLRVERQSQTAQQIAEYLQERHKLQQSSSSALIKDVHYPGLTTHPQHEIAKRQMIMMQHNDDDGMTGKPMFGGILSLEFHDDVAAMAFAGALRTIQRATSLGGTETLIEHRASIEPPGRVTSPPGLLRISVGLEDVTDLIRDMDRALSIVKKIVHE